MEEGRTEQNHVRVRWRDETPGERQKWMKRRGPRRGEQKEGHVNRMKGGQESK